MGNGTEARTAAAAGQVRSAWGGLLFLVALLAAVLFVAAGSLRYWQGWLFWLSFTGWVVWITAYFLKRDPALVKSRSSVGAVAETRPIQKAYQGLASVAFMATMFVPALDYRFGWTHVPLWGVVLGFVLVHAGLAGIAWVMYVNSYAASTIQVVEDQRVISTGPYAIVRHPMYAAAVLMLIGIPLLLGSWWGLFGTLFITIFMVMRLLDEEKALQADLPGYTEYMRKQRYRLLPGIW